jgi:hypothetical protein
MPNTELEEPYEVDWPAVEQRLAFLLYQMATLVIGERIKVDALAADSAIRYCRDRVNGASYNPARQEHFLEFICRCGGSMEWVMDGDITPLVVAYASARADSPSFGRPYRASLYEVTA